MKCLRRTMTSILLTAAMLLCMIPTINMTAYADSTNYLVLRDDAVEKIEFGSNNTWEGSTAQTWCTSYYTDYLAANFSDYIAGVDKTDAAEKVGKYNYGESTLKGATGTDNIDKVFFLSAKEYATYNESTTEVGNINATSLDWWLRSPCVDDYASDKTTFTGKVYGTVGMPGNEGKLVYHRVFFDDPAARPALYLKSDFFKAYKDDSGIRYWTNDKDAAGYTPTTDLEEDLSGNTNKLLLNDSTYWTVLGYKGKTPNPITIAETQSVNKTQSTSAQTETLAEATDAQGDVTYEIESQKKGSEDVTYFTLEGTTLSIGADTPVGTYTVVVKATAAGNDEYAEGSVTSTVTVTITKPPVTILVDIGAGHAALFTEDVLNWIKSEFSLQDATISGNVVTLKGVDPSMIQNDMQESIWNAIYNLTSAKDRIDNGEWFYDVGYKSIDDYATYKEFDDDTYSDERYSTPVSDGMTYYALWKKPYEKLEIDNGNPTCGMEARKAFPTTPDGMMLDPENYSWKDENNERVEKFEGGKEYTFNGQIYKKLNDDLWKYFIDPDNFTMTVKDAKDLEYSHSSSWIKFSFKTTVDHDWDEGKVTKKPTEKAEGVKTYTCKTVDCGATKTESIPKVKPTPTKASGMLLAKATAKGKTGMTYSWNKVKGAAGYDIFFAQCNHNDKTIACKKIKSIKGNKTFKWTKSGLKKGTAYKAYVKAYVMQNGKKKYVITSPITHSYTGNVKGKYTNAKSVSVNKTKVTLRKGKTFKIKAKINKVKKNKKLMPKSHVATLRYLSSNKNVATVSKSGKITAKGKGSCTVYAYAHNGISKQIKVTVK